MAYVEWAGPSKEARTVVCVHGLTRNGRDFDVLAKELARTYRVICPDIVGRGKSDWLADGAGYGYPQYLADLTVLLARLDVEEVDWVGTSMGGLAGILLAAQPKNPIRRLVLNDIGPLVPASVVERIGAYVGRAPSFATKAELEAYLRVIHEPFGPLTDAEWRHLAEHGSRTLPDGRLTLAYDPAIGEAFRGSGPGEVDLFPVYEKVTCPTLLVRGTRSDVVSEDIAARMAARGPALERYEVEGVGHAPALMARDQVEAVAGFLTRVG